MKKIIVFAILAAIVLGIGACGKKDDSSAAIRPVEAFYKGIVSQDRDSVSNVACADWEKDALREVDAFMGVKSELKDFSCKITETTDDTAIVNCSGKIAASYGAEVTDFPLEGRNHRVIKEQGEWHICGY